ncbi:MAG: alpha/beta hydrolase [Thioalkalispiraceae bacterium]|jgi:pimeloyl-ACP methyl ester carboxylesterase
MEQLLHTLQNGMKISYARYGVAGGNPALYFHGLPGSRLEGELLNAAAVKYGIDLIAPDRFGYGNSSPVRQGRYLTWVTAVEELTDTLHYDQFYLIAVSGGAPYALACASQLPSRVIATGICCGLGSLVVPELRAVMSMYARGALFLAGYSPWLLKISYGSVISLLLRCVPRQVVSFLGKINSKADQAILAESEVHRIMANNLACAFSRTNAGGIDDLVAANQAWPFELSRVKSLQLWHGEQDHVVAPLHSKWLQQQVPDSELHLVPGEGHFSLPIKYTERILKTLVNMNKI